MVNSSQLNCPKELLFPDIASDFQKTGITALIYDSRCVGESDGQPRNDTDSLKQFVDPDRVGYWGVSSSGTIVCVAAALDPRANFSILVCPRIAFTPLKRLPTILLKCIRDRESQLRGNAPSFVTVSHIPLLSLGYL